jgi:hypothetical protein
MTQIETNPKRWGSARKSKLRCLNPRLRVERRGAKLPTRERRTSGRSALPKTIAHRSVLISPASSIIFVLSAYASPLSADVSGVTVVENPQSQLNEIVVTSQRRSENLQTIPLSVTAATARRPALVRTSRSILRCTARIRPTVGARISLPGSRLSRAMISVLARSCCGRPLTAGESLLLLTTTVHATRMD